jgi:hypothetical protein
MRRAATAVLALAIVGPVMAGDARPQKPRLNLRATPRVAFSPVNVFATAELVGGEVDEQFHCPAVEWDWDDGARSVRESDCEPYGPGVEIERRFTAEHSYRAAGVYNVRVTVRRASRALAAATATISVQSAFGGGSE